MKILLVDDDPFALKLLTRQLTSLGYADVIACERARDALTRLETGEEEVGLIFCDLQMPDMDGVEFLRNLSRIGYSGSLVLVSGEDKRILQTVGGLALAQQLNLTGSLAKPCTPDQLEQVMKEYATRTAGPRRSVERSTDRRHDPARTYTQDELKRAIDSGDLINYYQPKIELRTGALAGVESLVRWRHTRDGIVYPDQFIGIAEQHGLIGAVTWYILKAALRQAVAWRQAGFDFKVAVNVSMEDISALDFPDAVHSALSEVGVPPETLVIEVTESQLVKNHQMALDILSRLRLKRIHVSIDDFGTGHSSLAQLRDFPFDELKIDKGFVHDAHRDESRRAIFGASLRLAKELGIRSVAEGVENAEDLAFVLASGCDQAQGYFIARPMPAEDLPGWLSKWEARRNDLLLKVDSSL